MACQAIDANYTIGPDPDQRLAHSPGWFSIRLGATEILIFRKTSNTNARNSCSNRSSVRSHARAVHARPW